MKVYFERPKTQQLNVRVEEKMLDEMKDIMNSTGVELVEVVRALLRAGLEVYKEERQKP